MVKSCLKAELLENISKKTFGNEIGGIIIVGDVMNLRNWLLRQIAETGLIDLKYDYFTDAEKESYDYQREEFRKFKNGEEINPPWVKYHSSMSPWELRHDHWLVDVWLPFWRKMDEEQRRTYQEKWDMPDDWYEIVTRHWTDINQ